MEAIYIYITYYNTERILTAQRTPPEGARVSYGARFTRYPQVMSLPKPPPGSTSRRNSHYY